MVSSPAPTRSGIARPVAPTSAPPLEPAETPAKRPFWKRKTWLFLALGLLLATILGGRFLLAPPVSPWVWYTAPVEVKPLELSVTATGTLTAVRTVEVGTQVSGVISTILVDFNSKVRKGQVIAELDKTVLQSSLADASSTLEKAQVQAQQSRREFDRAKQLFESKVSARTDYETAETNYETALASVRSAQTQLARARTNLGFATITAPIAGVVVDRKVDVGQTVAASFSTPTLFTIAGDLTQMQVEADVDEADIGQVKTGQEVSFEVDAYPGRTFQGEVKQIRLQPTVTQNVVTYTVIITVPNPDRTLLPGLTANLTIATAHHWAAPTVPSSALTFTPPATYFRNPQPAATPATELQAGAAATVWVLQRDSLQPVRVQIVATDGVNTQVKGALRAGQQVVTGQNVEATKKAATSFLPPPPSGKGNSRGPGL